MLRIISVWLPGLFALFGAVSARAAEPQVLDLDQEPAAGSEQPGKAADEPVEPGGLECSPAVSEIETRRPIPISCAVTRAGTSRIELRYKPPGETQFSELMLIKEGEEWIAEIPCSATAKAGELTLSLTARSAENRAVSRIDGVSFQLVESTEEAPPALPGRDAPARCPGPSFGKPPQGPELSCTASSDCPAGLACSQGLCRPAPARSPSEQDPVGGVSRRHHWFGVHLSADAILLREANGVCGTNTSASQGYACYEGEDLYGGPVNTNYREGGRVRPGMRLATLRVMGSYDLWLGRILVGVRGGFAFGGAPQNFKPLHLELRTLYSLIGDPLEQRLRPYLGLSGGLAQVDTKTRARVVDCSGSAPSCENASINQLRSGAAPGAREVTLDVYRKGSGIFFGPALGALYAFSEASAIQLHVNLMFPDLAIQPSLGFALGL